MLREFFKNATAEAAIEQVRKIREKADRDLDQVEKKINGDSRYFLKICDSEDPEEKDCPPPYPLLHPD